MPVRRYSRASKRCIKVEDRISLGRDPSLTQPLASDFICEGARYLEPLVGRDTLALAYALDDTEELRRSLS